LITETELLIKEEEARSNAMRARAKLPDDLLMELSEACGNYPADQLKLAYKACRKPPIAACKLAILPDEEASKDCATLAIQVCSVDIPSTEGTLWRCLFCLL
jgi:hypothetical protein